jgi:hypothetical protein
MHVARLGFAFEILEPAELRDLAAAMGRILTDAAESPRSL